MPSKQKGKFQNSQGFKGGVVEGGLCGGRAAELKMLTKVVRMGIVGHLLEANNSAKIKHGVYTDTTAIKPWHKKP